MCQIIGRHKGMLIYPQESGAEKDSNIKEKAKRQLEAVFVTHHAAERLADQRRAGRKIATEEAYKLLALTAVKGKKVGRRPGGAYEVHWQGLYAIVTREKGKLIVLTFNGDKEWRMWHNKQHVKMRRCPKALAAL